MNNKKILKSLRMDVKLAEAVERIAEKENRSFNYVVNEIIAKYLEEIEK